MRIRTCAPLIALTLPLLALACDSDQPTTRPMSFSQRQDQALRDPMGYHPDFSEDRISSGSIWDFDKKGFKKDMDSAFNP